MGIRKNDFGGEMREGAAQYQERHRGWAARHTCCFSLSLLLEAVMFTLFQRFSIFSTHEMS
jgi:hypothetical protein